MIMFISFTYADPEPMPEGEAVSRIIFALCSILFVPKNNTSILKN